MKYHVRKSRNGAPPNTVVTYESQQTVREYLRGIVQAYNDTLVEGNDPAFMLPDGSGAVSFEAGERVVYSVVRI